MASKPNLKGGLSGAAQGASMGMAAGPWGALAGGVIGGVSGLLSGEDDEAEAAAPYSVNESSFNAPSGGDYFNSSSGKAGGWWGQQAGAGPQGNKYVDWNRKEQRSARGTQEAGLQMLGQYARGDKSAAQLAAKAQQDRTMAAIQSRMASAPGGYNPSVQAAGINAVSGAGQAMAGTTAAAAAAEQLAAQKAYLQGTGQMRGQDLSSQLAEQQWYSQQAAAQTAYQNMKAKYLALGLDEKNSDRAAKMELEKLKSQNAATASGQSLTGQQIANQQSQYGSNRMDNYMMGGMGALSGYLQNEGTGQSGSGGIDTSGMGNSSPFKWKP